MKNFRILLLIVGVILVMAVFFMITTTTLSKPTTNKLFLSKEPGNTTRPPSVVNLLLYDDNNVYAYSGLQATQGKIYHTFDHSLRTYLLTMKEAILDSSFLVIIKPGNNATYKNTVDVLDEMIINSINRYSMTELTEPEQKIIDSLRKG